VEKNKKPISIDFDAIDSDLQEHQVEEKSDLSRKSNPKEREKKPRIVKKKEEQIHAAREKETSEKGQHKSNTKGSIPMENTGEHEIDNIQNDIGLNLNQIAPIQDPIKEKPVKKQSKTKENSNSSDPLDYEIEFWKDQNASCYMTFKPGIERQIIKRVKNNNISYTIEYNPEL